MGASKTDEYSIVHLGVASLAKAIGHPARVAILEILAMRSNCICGELVEELPLSQPTVSQHLKELKLAGLIKGKVEGNSLCYCIDTNNLERLQAFISNLIEKNKRTNCC